MKTHRAHRLALITALAAGLLLAGCATTPPPQDHMLCDSEGGCTTVAGAPYGYGAPGYVAPGYGYGLFGFGSWWYSRPSGYATAPAGSGTPAVTSQGGTRSAPSTRSSPGRRGPAASGRRR